ncbi:MAG: hypothetical protein QW692_04235 [Nitrososphaerota archaeon]
MADLIEFSLIFLIGLITVLGLIGVLDQNAAQILIMILNALLSEIYGYRLR